MIHRYWYSSFIDVFPYFKNTDQLRFDDILHWKDITTRWYRDLSDFIFTPQLFLCTTVPLKGIHHEMRFNYFYTNGSFQALLFEFLNAPLVSFWNCHLPYGEGKQFGLILFVGVFDKLFQAVLTNFACFSLHGSSCFLMFQSFKVSAFGKTANDIAYQRIGPSQKSQTSTGSYLILGLFISVKIFKFCLVISPQENVIFCSVVFHPV